MDDEAGKITLVKYLQDVRDRLPEGALDHNELRSATDALGYVLHDVFCTAEDHTDNIVFTVVVTADGPFVDWKLRTPDEWLKELNELDTRLVAARMLRKLFGIG